MAFSFFELSRKQGRPIELYLFKWGSAGASYYAYTNAERAVTYNGIVYNPIAINRSNITVSGTIDKTDLNVVMPHTTALSELTRYYPPGDIISLTIYQGHSGDPDNEFKVIWRGRVIGVTRKDSEATARCQGYMTSLRRQGMKRCYMYGCPHTLYGPKCNADKTAAKATVLVQAVASDLYSFTAPSNWHGDTDVSNFVGGTCEYTGSDGNSYVCTVIATGGTNDRGIITNAPLLALAQGQYVSMYWGCDHSMTGCNIHGNIKNFGGDPWIPYKDPTGIFNNSFY